MSLYTQSLFSVFFSIALGIPTESLTSPTYHIDTRDNNFVWASVGDSWAAGVSYSPTQHTDYDDDKNGCHRWKDSYGPIMARNTSWTTNDQTFNFAACKLHLYFQFSDHYTLLPECVKLCLEAFVLLGPLKLSLNADCIRCHAGSGAILVNIVASPQGDNPKQMDLVGNPQMITYHAGGNNCGFGGVVSDCVYQPGFGYGKEYPDPSGRCAQSIANSNNYINKAGNEGLYQDEMNTVTDLLNHPSVKDNKDFKLYILGYAHFFNLGANYCDDISFGVMKYIPRGSAPKLSNQLRTDMNDGVERVNQILKRVATDVNDTRVEFLDISPAFSGHRFCENNHNYQDQWYSTDVWLWNFNTPADDPPADPNLMNQWINAYRFPDNTTLPEFPNGTTIGVETQRGVETDGSGGSTGSPTWSLRPFHPKQGGTQAIANIVIAQALADKIPGVKGSAPPSTGTCDCNEDGCTPESPVCCANGTCS